MRAIAVIPTYNESANLEELVRRIEACAPGLDLLVVDDNSPDGTGEIADRLSAARPGRISVLHRERKDGLGRAYVAAFRKVLAEGYDVILQMDADLSHDPVYIPKLLARLERCDLVLGSRYVHGINVVNWDFKRLLLSKLAGMYVRAVTRMPVSDPTGGFKCWRRAALEAMPLDRIFGAGYVFQVEMNYSAYRAGFRIGEEPIIFYERNLGASKMDWRIILEALFGIVRVRFSHGARRAARTRPKDWPAAECAER
ncbi:MAG: polyprenol monophosphomannose synthase [Acidobacteriota bacterium]